MLHVGGSGSGITSGHGGSVLYRRYWLCAMLCTHGRTGSGLWFHRGGFFGQIERPEFAFEVLKQRALALLPLG